MRRSILGLTIAAMVTACGDGPTSPEELEGGALATFAVSGEEFQVWVTNDAAIEQILALRDGTSDANIPNGELRPGPGVGRHNAPWRWHLDAREIEMAEQAIEVCDGRPSLVDELLDDYLEVARFCPWGAELVSVDDRR